MTATRVRALTVKIDVVEANQGRIDHQEHLQVTITPEECIALAEQMRPNGKIVRLRIRVQGRTDKPGVHPATGEELKEHLRSLGFNKTELFTAPGDTIEILPRNLP